MATPEQIQLAVNVSHQLTVCPICFCTVLKGKAQKAHEAWHARIAKGIVSLAEAIDLLGDEVDTKAPKSALRRLLDTIEIG